MRLARCAATFGVEDNKGEVAHLPPNDQGRFRASLALGHYKASPKGRKSSIAASALSKAMLSQAR
jgi:hypothetical protein